MPSENQIQIVSGSRLRGSLFSYIIVTVQAGRVPGLDFTGFEVPASVATPPGALHEQSPV